MDIVFYQEHRIEISPTTIPGGWSAQVHVWSCHGGTTRMVTLFMPTHIPFSTEAGARAYGEKVARRWVDEVCAGRTQPSSTAFLAPDDAMESQRRKKSRRNSKR